MFHCLSGRVPFPYTTPSEVLNAHAREQPKRVDQLAPTVPRALGLIVEKLLAKDPDERYLSASSLLRDLEQLDRLQEKLVGGESLSLGSSVQRVRAEEVPFVGREGDLARASRSVRSALAQSELRVLLVEGEAGSGKSRIVREALASASDHHDLLTIHAKAEQGELSPLGPIRQALRDVVTQCIARKISPSMSDETLPFVARIEPSTVQLVDREVPTVVPIDGEAEQERFYDRIALFFAELADERPVVFALDDVQWLDDGSLNVMRRIVERCRSKAFSLATTARNDPSSRSALEQFRLVVSNEKHTTIELGPLSDEIAGALIAHHLGGRSLPRDINSRLNARARGNPFALGEYSRALIEQGVLRLSEEGWEFDESLDVSLPTDVLRLVESRIVNLGPTQLETLSIGAILGYRFSSDVLSHVLGSRSKALIHIQDGLSANILEPVSPNEVSFVHDRLREALLSGEFVQKQGVESIHRRISAALIHGGDVCFKDRQQYYYACARHLREIPLENEPFKREAFDATFEAARLSASEHAHVEAFSFAETAGRIAGSLELSSEERRDLNRLTASTALLAGDYDASEAALRPLLEGGDAKATSEARYLLSQVYHARGDQTRAWEELNVALRAIGSGFPTNTFLQVVSLIGLWLSALFRMRTNWGFGSAKGEERERRKRVAEMLGFAWLVVWLEGEPLHLLGTVIRSLHNAHFLGVSASNAKARATYGMILAALNGEKKQERALELCRGGVAMAEQIGDAEAHAYCLELLAFSTLFGGDADSAKKLLDEKLDGMMVLISPWDQAAMLSMKGYLLVVQGKTEEALAWVKKHQATIESRGTVHFLTLMKGMLYSHSILHGNVKDAALYREQQLELAKSLPYKFVECYVHLQHMMALLEQGELGEEFEKAERGVSRPRV